MQVELKEHYKGQLELRFNNLTRQFEYTLVHYPYPKNERLVEEIEEGDELIVRSPQDGSIIIHRIVEFDYDSHKRMNMETGSMHQTVSGQPVTGILTNIEPTFWFNLFAQGYYADLIKKV